MSTCPNTCLHRHAILDPPGASAYAFPTRLHGIDTYSHALYLLSTRAHAHMSTRAQTPVSTGMLFWILEASARMQGTCDSAGGFGGEQEAKRGRDLGHDDEPNAYCVLVDRATAGD